MPSDGRLSLPTGAQEWLKRRAGVKMCACALEQRNYFSVFDTVVFVKIFAH